MNLLITTENYINTILSLQIKPTNVCTAQINNLPLFIRKNYLFSEWGINGVKLLLLLSDSNNLLPISDRINHLLQVRKIINIDTVLVIPTMTARDRKRLIKNNISFIVPGKQLYLPNLLIDLREHFDQQYVQTESLLPSAQMILLYHLQKKSFSGISLTEIGTTLGYSRMTISRAARALTSLKLCRLSSSGQSKLMHFDLGKNELWEKSHPLMRSPIHHTIYIVNTDIIKKLNALPAGILALSMISNISAGNSKVYAVSHDDFRNYKKYHQVKSSEFEDEGIALELWNYAPIRVNNDIVDPLSLKLSLSVNPDERVRAALNRLIWSK